MEVALDKILVCKGSSCGNVCEQWGPTQEHGRGRVHEWLEPGMVGVTRSYPRRTMEDYSIGYVQLAAQPKRWHYCCGYVACVFMCAVVQWVGQGPPGSSVVRGGAGVLRRQGDWGPYYDDNHNTNMTL